MNPQHRDFAVALATNAARYARDRVIAKDHLLNEDCGEWGDLEDAAQFALNLRYETIIAWRVDNDEMTRLTNPEVYLVTAWQN